MITTKYSWGELEPIGTFNVVCYRIKSKQFGVVGIVNKETGWVTDKRGVPVDNVYADGVFGKTDSDTFNDVTVSAAFSTAKLIYACKKSNEIPLTVDAPPVEEKEVFIEDHGLIIENNPIDSTDCIFTDRKEEPKQEVKSVTEEKKNITTKTDTEKAVETILDGLAQLLKAKLK